MSALPRRGCGGTNPERRARRGPRAAPAGSTAGRAARRPPPRSRTACVSPVGVVEDAVLARRAARVVTAASRSAHVVLLGAGEVLQQVAELVGRHDAQVDRQPGVRRARPPRASPAVPSPARRTRSASSSASARRERGRVVGRGDDVEVLDGLGQPARAAGELAPRPPPGARAGSRRSPRRPPARGAGACARAGALGEARRRTRRAPTPRTSARSP